MYWLRTPQKVYFKKGCMSVALDELKTVYTCKRAFIITDTKLYKNGNTAMVEAKLDQMGIMHTCFFALDGTATLEQVKNGAESAALFEPDVFIAVGSGEVIDAAKLIRVLYGCPGADIRDISAKFNDITARDHQFSEMRKKSILAAIPVTSGSGSEMSPFSVIKDGEDRLSVASYSIMPDIAVVDVDFSIDVSVEETASGGMTVLAHALEAYFSETATEYTDGFAIKAIVAAIEYLPSVCKNGSNDPVAREKISEASAMSGIAFANAGNIGGISFESACPFCAVKKFIELIRNAQGEPLEKVRSLSDAVGNDIADKLEAVFNACKD